MKFTLFKLYCLVCIATLSIHPTQDLFAQSTRPLAASVKQLASKYSQTKLGKNVYVFDPSMDMAEIQTLIDSIHAGQLFPANEFSKNRYALLFQPGTYHLDVRVGYYTHVMGLGKSPEDVVIVGAVRSNSTHGGHVLCNFWRSAENLSIVPTSADTTNTWAVSQAAPLRRVHVKGHLKLFEGASSGGFMANCKVDGTVFSGSQQQWLTRNSAIGHWNGGVWNMVFMGVVNAPEENWPDKPVTTINTTPSMREKPYWTYQQGEYWLTVPKMKVDARGTDWENQEGDGKENTISIKEFYIAQAEIDNAQSLNKALESGKNLLLTPGIYTLDQPVRITRSGTIVIGMGMATLLPTNGNMAIDVGDVSGVTIASILIDAGQTPSELLMRVGTMGSRKSHASNPSFLYDVFFRVGGPHLGATKQCLQINSNNVVADHLWLWRADHGEGVGWYKNRCANGLEVNGNDVTVMGLFNEHFQEYQTLWNGEKGRVYFYQSEMPYDPPALEAWKHGSTNGYASYKVADRVKQHHAWAVGIYNVFYDAPIIVDQAIETPLQVEANMYHKVIFWLNGNKESQVKSIINGKGGGVNSANRKATMR